MWLHQHRTPLPFDQTESEDWTLNAHWAFLLIYCVWLCYKEIWELKELNIRKVSVQQCWACSRFPADKKTPLYRCDTLCAIERNGCLYRCWHLCTVCVFTQSVSRRRPLATGVFFTEKCIFVQPSVIFVIFERKDMAQWSCCVKTVTQDVCSLVTFTEPIQCLYLV